MLATPTLAQVQPNSCSIIEFFLRPRVAGHLRQNKLGILSNCGIRRHVAVSIAKVHPHVMCNHRPEPWRWVPSGQHTTCSCLITLNIPHATVCPSLTYRISSQPIHTISARVLPNKCSHIHSHATTAQSLTKTNLLQPRNCLASHPETTIQHVNMRHSENVHPTCKDVKRCRY